MYLLYANIVAGFYLAGAAAARAAALAHKEPRDAAGDRGWRPAVRAVARVASGVQKLDAGVRVSREYGMSGRAAGDVRTRDVRVPDVRRPHFHPVTM
eukprot:scaffold69720_cov36-Phaeocystis_antarctica.AAC.1